VSTPEPDPRVLSLLRKVPVEHAAPLAVLLTDLVDDIVTEQVAGRLGQFTEWVACTRAYNGSPHHRGQSLYNESLNEVLLPWAADFVREEIHELPPLPTQRSA
jgi:hypothetical protein